MAGNDQGQKQTRTRAHEHAERRPKGDTRKPAVELDPIEQRQKRTQLAFFDHYPENWEIVTIVRNEGAPALQIRKTKGGFTLYRRDPIS